MHQQTNNKLAVPPGVAAPRIRIATLGSGISPGLTPALGQSLAEAAIVCLEKASHASGIALEVRGDTELQYDLHWDPATDQMFKAYADDQVAIELGACGIACLLVEHMEHLSILERSCKGTGFDYWLGPVTDTGTLFQDRSRLEVSGIAKESGSNTVSARVKQKLQQTEQSDDTLLPAIVIVVLFEEPSAHKEKRQ